MHAFVLERGQVCSRCGVRRTRMPGIPKLIPLEYGPVHCELCKGTIVAGQRVAWWGVKVGAKTRTTAYCPDCHHANVTHGRALR